MTEQIVKYEAKNMVKTEPPKSLNELVEMAGFLAKSRFWGMDENQIISLMLVAQADGIPAVNALREYSLIKEKPSMKAEAMQARFQQHGGIVKWLVVSDVEVSAEFNHPSSSPVVISWTIEMAQRAGLANKDVWKKYPLDMLRSRCISRGVRTCYPGVILGIYTPEEVESFSEPVTQYNTDIVDVTPAGEVVAVPKTKKTLTQSDMITNLLAKHGLSEDEALYKIRELSNISDWPDVARSDIASWEKIDQLLSDNELTDEENEAM